MIKDYGHERKKVRWEQHTNYLRQFGINAAKVGAKPAFIWVAGAWFCVGQTGKRNPPHYKKQMELVVGLGETMQEAYAVMLGKKCGALPS